MKRARFVLAVLLVAAVGVALRTWPLWHSPLPFNPDGIIYAGDVATAHARGTLPLGRMAVDDLQFTAFLTVLSRVTGQPARFIAQPTIAVVGTLPAVLVVAAARRFGIRYGASWARAAGVLAAGLLAVEGLYLHRSMPVDEQTLGLFFVPLGVYALARAGSDRRWLVPLGFLLVALPPTHNLDSTIMGVLLLATTVLFVARGVRTRVAGLLVGGTLLYWLYLVGYTIGVAQFTPARVIQSARITDIPGLFVAWLLLAAFATTWLVMQETRTQRSLLVVGFSSLFALLGVNALVPVFPGLPATNIVILVGVSCLIIPVLAAAYGAPIATSTRFGVPFMAQLAAVFAFVGLTLTAALTPEYLNTLYRAQTFAHFPALAFAALGVVAVAQARGWRPTDAGTHALVALVLVAAVASVPVAYGGLDVLAYKGVTTEAEFEASGFAVEHVPGSWAGDDHLTRITGYYGPNQSYSVLPVHAWMHDGAPPPTCPVLSQQSWTTTGAQFYPRSPVAVPESAYASFVRDRQVVYASGGSDTLILSTPQHAGDHGC